MNKIVTMAAIGLMTAATPCFAWVDAPVQSREHHDVWKMRCFPVDNIPFDVMTGSVAGGLVLIYGRNGVIRQNKIESVTDSDAGFIVFANGFDFHGRHREIELHVTKGGSSALAVNRDIDNMIHCGSASAASDD